MALDFRHNTRRYFFLRDGRELAVEVSLLDAGAVRLQITFGGLSVSFNRQSLIVPDTLTCDEAIDLLREGFVLVDRAISVLSGANLEDVFNDNVTIAESGGTQ